MGRQPQLQTPGELLTNSRKAAGYSMTEVSERTKIPLNMLEAIEHDEFHKLSGPLYIKSFLQSYAEDVGLDPEEVLMKYHMYSGEDTSIGMSRDAGFWSEDVEISTVGLPWTKIVLSAIAGFLLLGGCLYTAFNWDQVSSLFGSEESTPVVTDSAQMQEPIVLATDDSTGVAIPAETPIEFSVKNDTLAFGWEKSADLAAAQSASQTAEPVKKPERVLAENVVTAPVAVNQSQHSTRNTPAGRGHLPRAYPGDLRVDFKDDQNFILILRITCNSALTASVKKDGQRQFVACEWPVSAENVLALPPDKLESGVIYAARQGYVAYWGAKDHFSLVLDKTEDVEVSINGVVRDVSGLRPGQEIVLYDNPSSASERN